MISTSTVDTDFVAWSDFTYRWSSLFSDSNSPFMSTVCALHRGRSTFRAAERRSSWLWSFRRCKASDATLAPVSRRSCWAAITTNWGWGQSYCDIWELKQRSGFPPCSMPGPASTSDPGQSAAGHWGGVARREGGVCRQPEARRPAGGGAKGPQEGAGEHALVLWAGTAEESRTWGEVLPSLPPLLFHLLPSSSSSVSVDAVHEPCSNLQSVSVRLQEAQVDTELPTTC